ncbi:hypothetical protein C162_21973 [Paenibacillus sp. FSL R7-269]|uniref:hypothetical protein n=1 Tax=Paenibacillus sp. FSL R7-269 TaxID=1226755 RepID=UPI0003E203A5|nr:hypothetical protein [Paenibacillus sp. FSL R7-269]ETT45249.1 hypothetical protein C162_21973 [Paenibacillus sp. FSL R7-269]
MAVHLKTSENSLPVGNVVKTVMIGGGKVEFCDDFVARTPEAIQRVKKDIYTNAWAIVMRLRSEGVSI